MPAQSDIEHLLRRTEFVARPGRVEELVAKSTLAEAVDDVLAADANPGSVVFAETHDWHQGVELTHYWLDRMAHDSRRPIQEKMGLFWHGHFCSDLGKVGSAVLMREQIDTFRRDGMGNLRELAKTISTQVAMLRYLDNNQNKKSSPNQNFARELMELFLLGVGNYTEADVEAGTAAWTGHGDDWQTDEYVWHPEWHDTDPKSYLGQTINLGSDWTRHGAETIDVILGDGRVPVAAAAVANRGRNTRDVVAEFISNKLWTAFAGTSPSAAVIEAMRAIAIAEDFAITPWLRAMLLRPEFYSAEVRDGRVRSPVDWVVAALAGTGMRSAGNTPIWLLDGMGQRPLYPPNVSGWKHNAYWVNASAMSRRTSAAQHFGWRATTGYWNGDGLIHLAGGTISRSEVSAMTSADAEAFVDQVLTLMQIEVSATTRTALVDFAASAPWWERNLLPTLVMISPDFHLG